MFLLLIFAYDPFVSHKILYLLMIDKSKNIVQYINLFIHIIQSVISKIIIIYFFFISLTLNQTNFINLRVMMFSSILKYLHIMIACIIQFTILKITILSKKFSL